MTDYICVLDFEATCWEENLNHEIIEFPSVLLSWNPVPIHVMSKKKKYEINEVSRKQLFVKPLINPTVSKFCHKLTGITQKQVDNGICIKTALSQHLKWLTGISETNRITIVTHGDWDLKTMLPMDLKNYPAFGDLDEIYMRYVNIKDLFHQITGIKGTGMVKMLAHLKLKQEGRHHSGIDDCHNIARMFMKLVDKGLDKKRFLDNVKYVDYMKFMKNIQIFDHLVVPDVLDQSQSDDQIKDQEKDQKKEQSLKLQCIC